MEPRLAPIRVAAVVTPGLRWTAMKVCLVSSSVTYAPSPFPLLSSHDVDHYPTACPAHAKPGVFRYPQFQLLVSVLNTSKGELEQIFGFTDHLTGWTPLGGHDLLRVKPPLRFSYEWFIRLWTLR